MDPFGAIFYLIGGPLVLAIGWFGRLTRNWLILWFIVGGLTCGALVMMGLSAPSMDWGYTIAIAGVWTFFWCVGGAIQVYRLLTQASNP
ncbi:MAG: hypothetical protein QNI84_04305 [Henriciella sp.]|nr:hypothetical protein [Henriciella sp.]